MPELSGTFELDALARNSGVAHLFPKSATWLTEPPIKGTALPVSGEIASVTCGTGNGGDGAYRFTGIAEGEYRVGIVYAGTIIWVSHSVGATSGQSYAAEIVLMSGFTPAGTGADASQVVVPFSPADGTTVVTYNVRRIDFRVSTAGGAPAITVEKSTAAGAFSATTVGTVTLGSGASEGSVTAALGTVQSGNKLRVNVGTLGTATGWTVQALLGS